MPARDDGIVSLLLRRGVSMPHPASVHIGPEVRPERIAAQGVVIHPGCRITGRATFIAAGVHLGTEAPVTLDDCRIGPDAALKGGYFSRAVLLAGARVGSGAHVRAGTILEEGARAAHTVGLKHTILFPFVTLGSLINFCDCLMAGGTSPTNHSEVGSSYIHFNYTPHQDKATASLLGDVPCGVMLRQPPIFLGGQGGLVGPARLAFGTVVAAGTIQRKDEPRPSRLIVGGSPRGANRPFTPGRGRNSAHLFANNLIYIANLVALQQWYDHLRPLFVGPVLPAELLEALQAAVRGALDERIRRLAAFCRRLPAGDLLVAGWPRVADALDALRDAALVEDRRDRFLAAVETARAQRPEASYPDAVGALEPSAVELGTAWLKAVVTRVVGEGMAAVPHLEPLNAPLFADGT